MPTESASTVNAAGLAFSAMMAILLLALPRRYAVLPIVLLMCFMTMGQNLLIAGLNFPMFRVLILAGWVRVAIRREFRDLRLITLEKVLLAWVLSSIITYTALVQTSDALVNRLGLAYNAIGLYFLFRCLIRGVEDLQRVSEMLIASLIPLAVFMLVEKTTGRNPFGVFGGVPEVTFVREGVRRCQGPFSHPILAGTLGATLMPLALWFWWRGTRGKTFAILGILASTVIVVTSGSSGPVFAMMAAAAAFCLWPFRRNLRIVRWGFLILLICLQIAMKAPVWFLIARVEAFSGSTGYHRAMLIDRFIANFREWWLIGTQSTDHWGFGLFDTTNQFVFEGVHGGLLTMALFIALVSLAFQSVGRAMRTVRAESRQRERLFWTLGVGLFAHVISFMSVSYFDQSIVNWYLLLAMISTAFISTRKSAQTSAQAVPEMNRAQHRVPPHAALGY